jgi:translation initiation factor 1
MSRKERIPTDGAANPLAQNPFAALSSAGLPHGAPSVPSVPAQPATKSAPPAKKNRGRVEVRRETAGRGGKTVTSVSGFIGIGLPEKEALAKQMQRACGTGGTVKDGRIEIQGDHREKIAAILAEAGFRPVFAGG